MNKLDINLIAEIVLDFHHFEKASSKIYLEDDCFDKVTGFLSSENAKKLIQGSKKSKIIKRLLPQFFYFCNTDTISDQVFTMIKHYSNSKIRKSLYTSISHCDLSLYQLQHINDKILCLEAFAKLLDYYLHYDCFTYLDLDRLLKNKTSLIRGIDWSSFCTKSINLQKQEVLRNYVLIDEKRS